MQEARYQTDKSLFIARAESQGAEVIFDSSGNDALRQLQQFEEMLESGLTSWFSSRSTPQRPARWSTWRMITASRSSATTRCCRTARSTSWSCRTAGPLVGCRPKPWSTGSRHPRRSAGRVRLIRGQPGDANAAALSSGALEIIDKHPGLGTGRRPQPCRLVARHGAGHRENLLVEYDNAFDAFICNNSGLAFGVLAALRDEDLPRPRRFLSPVRMPISETCAWSPTTCRRWKSGSRSSRWPIAAADIAIKIAQVAGCGYRRSDWRTHADRQRLRRDPDDHHPGYCCVKGHN